MRKAIFPVLLGLVILNQCVPPPAKPRPTSDPKMQSVNSVLSKKGVYAEDSFYACILNLYYQGIPLKQAGDECATKLLEDDKKGLFDGDKRVIETPMGRVGPGSEQFFDPNKITAACGAGDPRVGQSSSGVGKWPGKGEYTWGGDSKNYHGYAKEDSYKMKEEAVKAWEESKKEFWEAHDKAEAAKKELDEAKKGGDQAEIKKAQEKYDKAYQEAQKKASDSLSKSREAEADPNKKPKTMSSTVQGETPCEQALQAARELLWECHRTKWQAFQCQQLKAKMNNCPDPALILVDPDQGYTCGAQIDKEAVKNAWVARCEQIVRYGPGGDNPCKPPTFDKPGRYVKGKGIPNGCEPDPYSYINPDDQSCVTEVEVRPFGQPDIQEILVYALNKLGGPVVVIPKDPNPPPRPGPDPRPGPK